MNRSDWSSPSGTFFRGAGFAIGQYSDIALDVIQREYNAVMSVEQDIRLGNKGIEKALGEKPLVETGLVTAKEGYLRKLLNNDLPFFIFNHRSS